MHLAAAIAVMATVMTPTTRARAEHEAGAEDDGDDEHDARHDADPCGNDIELAAPTPLVDVARLDDGRCRSGGWGRCRSGVDRAGGWFWGGRCFGHVPNHRRGGDAPIMNHL
jgi:hypothetical protein